MMTSVAEQASDQAPNQVPDQAPAQTEPDKSWAQTVFLAIAILFNLCLAAQLLTVGLAVFTDAAWWQVHVVLVRAYSGLAILLLAGSFMAPFSKRIQALTKGMTILLTLQFVTANIQQPIHLGVLHPLLGFALFTTSTTLVHRTMPLVSVFQKTGKSSA